MNRKAPTSFSCPVAVSNGMGRNNTPPLCKTYRVYWNIETSSKGKIRRIKKMSNFFSVKSEYIFNSTWERLGKTVLRVSLCDVAGPTWRGRVLGCVVSSGVLSSWGHSSFQCCHHCPYELTTAAGAGPLCRLSSLLASLIFPGFHFNSSPAPHPPGVSSLPGFSV